MVLSGVNRLISMQTPSGGFGVWPGESRPVPWGTAYVTHTLIDAQKAGFAVPSSRIDDALRYLEGEVEKIERGVSPDRDFKYNMSADQWEPYVHYVLALGGRARKARAQKLVKQLARKGTLKGQDKERDYLLKAAVHLAGDHRYEADLKKPDSSQVTDERSYSYAYYSDIRRRGFTLNVFQDLFGSDEKGEDLALRVAESLKGRSRGFSTQDLSWGVSGLGKRVAAMRSRFATPKLVANGKKIDPQPNAEGAKTSDKTWALARASEYKTLVLTMPKVEGNVYLLLSSEGVRLKGDYTAGGEGLSVSRAYRSLDGSKVDFTNGSHALGDMIFSELTITNTSNQRVTNIALVDRFPAGWEIENPRLGRGTQAAWINSESLWKADYLDFRDDRLQVFGDLNPRESRTVVYTLRVVTAGNFVGPPLEAEAMYNPKVWARDTGRPIDIGGPWNGLLD